MLVSGLADARRWARPRAAACVAALTLGCGRGAASSAVEGELAAALATQLGRAPEVRCPPVAPSFRCRARVEGVALSISVAQDAGRLTWRLEGEVISGDRLERYLAGELAELGVAATPSCGPPFQEVTPGARVTCRLSGRGIAWATFRGDGDYSIEIALDDAEAARAEVADPSLLDELSRALDRDPPDEPDGLDDGDGDDDPDGVGAAAPGARAAAPRRGWER
ncbi:MAG: hypothetical protein R3B48_10990 [Kofleriaceae bacterium]